jgi:hypothetical protein
MGHTKFFLSVVLFLLGISGHLAMSSDVTNNHKEIRIKLNKVATNQKGFMQFYESNNSPDSSSSHIILENYQNLVYVGELSIGNPAQPFKVLFDTGSEYIWVPDVAVKEANFLNKFNCTSSSSCAKDDDRLVSITYGAGKIQGNLASDSIHVSPAMKADNQTFVITSNFLDLNHFIADGICGLGISKEYPGLLENLKSQGVIDRQMFSMYLDNNPEAYADAFSEIIINGVDEKYYKGNFSYVPLADNHSWTLNMMNVQLDNVSLFPSASKALIDSGSSIMVIPQSDFEQLSSAFQNQFNHYCFVDSATKLLKCECPNGNINNFPTLNFTFENYSFTLPPSFYIDQDQNVCSILIDSAPNITMWVLGNVFMRYYYTVFDAEEKRIGFALANPVKLPHVKITEIIFVSAAMVIICLFGVLIILCLRFALSKTKGAESFEKLIDRRDPIEFPSRGIVQ